MCDFRSDEEDPQLPISTRRVEGHAVVSVAGEVDMANVGQLRRELLHLVRTGEQRVVVDLTEVDYLDSTGLGVLVATRRRLHANRGTLHLVICRDAVRKLFAITHLDAAFPISRTLEEALSADRADI